MKKLVRLVLIMFSAITLVTCTTATPQSTENTIRPGDIIGDFLITTGNEGEVVYPSSSICTDQENHMTFSCKSSVGKVFNITAGIYDDTADSSTPTPKLSEDWTNYRYEVSIEGRPVDLQAFGYIDVPHPLYGVIRYWNVVIGTDKPGEIAVHDSGATGEFCFANTTIYKFSEP